MSLSPHRLDIKALVVLMAIASLFLGLSYLVLNHVVLPAFQALEEEEARDNLDRVRSAIRSDLAHLRATASDWAFWDHTAEFVEGKRDDYEAENLTASSFHTLKVDLVYLYDRGGGLRWGKAFDADGAVMTLEPFVGERLPPDHPLRLVGDGPEGRSGVMLTERGPFLIVAKPLIGSDRDRPSAGTLIFGQALREPMIASLRERTRVAFDLWPVGSEPADHADIPGRLALDPEGPAASVVAPPLADTVWSFGTIADIEGKQGLLVRAATPRTITAAGSRVVEVSMVFMVVAAVADMAVVWLLLHRLIIRPIRRLKDHIGRSGPGEQLELLGWERRDEIGVLARAFDRLQVDVRRHTQALASAMEHVVAAGQAKAAFMASMSHELRTPLNAIIGFSDVMAREMFGPLQNPRYREYANDIHISGEHLLNLVNQVLDMSKAESGRLELSEEPIELDELGAAAIRMVTPQAAQAGIALECKIAPGVPPLLGDRLRLMEVLLNLLSNAVKFSDPGGSVTLSAWCAERGGIGIEVRDTGVGMSPDDIPRAMAPFVQLDNNHGRNLKGTGLGLPLARKMTELHGGEFLLASGLGEGTRATLLFPAARVAPAELRA
ncbi:MAG: CHASE4 domain-containing protein [Alphaproteobacteria bacterium]